MTTASKPETLNPDDFLTFTKVAKGLPGIKPRVVQSALKKLLSEMVGKDQTEVSVQGGPVLMSELQELYHQSYRTGYPSDVVSPAGARLLVRLYLANALEMQLKKQPTAPTAELLAYCASEPELLVKQRERAAKHAAFEARLANPALFQEAEFTWGLLNRLFWKHGGKDARELTVGGLVIHKHLATYASNSGKSRDHKVSFTWKSPDGTQRSIEGQSAYEDNRRNDEKRNWGLYE